MYKTKLQELCHEQAWTLPEYSTSKDGPDHGPRFKSTVTVNGVEFGTPDDCRSSKESQNKAAKLALDHFTTALKPPQHSPSIASSSGYSTLVRKFDMGPSTGVTLQPTIQEKIPTALVDETPLGVKNDRKSPGYSTSSITFDIRPSTGVTLQPTIQKMIQTPLVNETPLGVQDDEKSAVVQHYYKNRLQNYAQKRNLALPVYSCERQGPPHASRFKSKVMIDGQTYESLEFFPTIREAELAAAKVACESLSHSELQEDDSSLYKNLLQELAQKKGFSFPKYDTTVSGPPHTPIFVSTVEIGGQLFSGQEAKNKKQAEMNAAKVAYIGLQERRSSGPPIILSSDCHIKEALKATSSILQSVISTGDSQQTIKPKANLTIHEKQNKEDKDGNQEKFSSKSTNVNADAGTHHPHFLPPEADINAKRHKCSSSSDIVYARLRDPFPSSSSSPEDGPSFPSTPSECSTNSVMDSTIEPPAGTSTLLCNKVLVYPVNRSMTLPDGATVLPFSDDKWVAAKMDSNQNQ